MLKIAFLCIIHHLSDYGIVCGTRREYYQSENDTIEFNLKEESVLIQDASSDENTDKRMPISNLVLCLVLICVIIGLICLSQIILHLRNFIRFGIFPSICEKCWWETRYPN